MQCVFFTVGLNFVPNVLNWFNMRQCINKQRNSAAENADSVSTSSNLEWNWALSEISMIMFRAFTSKWQGSSQNSIQKTASFYCDRGQRSGCHFSCETEIKSFCIRKLKWIARSPVRSFFCSFFKIEVCLINENVKFLLIEFVTLNLLSSLTLSLCTILNVPVIRRSSK